MSRSWFLQHAAIVAALAQSRLLRNSSSGGPSVRPRSTCSRRSSARIGSRSRSSGAREPVHAGGERVFLDDVHHTSVIVGGADPRGAAGSKVVSA